MKKYKFEINQKTLNGDLFTPVSLFLKLRDKYPGSILLESSDYHGNEDIYTYICCDPVSTITADNHQFTALYPDGSEEKKDITRFGELPDYVSEFVSQFEIPVEKKPYVQSGLFGYSSYDAVRYFEDVEIDTFNSSERKIPDMVYNIYRFVLVFNHFNNELFVFELTQNGESKVEEIETAVKGFSVPQYYFKPSGEESSNFTDQEYMDIVQKGKDHCHRGDVFQIVLSRRFEQKYEGDDFNLYRALRSINPSPYLFYFDYGGFRLMGSSPEAQIVIKGEESIIYPIAGTFRRTGDDAKDAELADELSKDPKESAEHVMLVDLARNDLSRHCEEVHVDTYKEVQYYSHVIHLVSKVVGSLNDKENFMHTVADTFPAGTLSGAPKHRAMQLINQYENGNRGYYGGAIGFIGFDGDFNHAIMIRSFLSKDNTLYYQAGAGVVELSNVESEKNEVNNKLAALKKAISVAKEI